ncbi:MAG: hypothetical protein IJW14_04730 [Oscillospiraceae bacterium]|nr:hypothetical protein [Oscillospiraceae bacterium]
MKEKIYTIPVNEAFDSGDECPFCQLERAVEQRTIRYTLGPGASYMEPEVRLATDKEGFCGAHFKKMYDFGNSLGSALMMQTYMVGLFEEMTREMDNFQIPGKRGLFSKKNTGEESSLVTWARGKQGSCFICNKIDYNMERYYSTFFQLTKEAEFRAKVESSKGFCMRHFLALMEAAKDHVPNDQREWFYPTVFRLMKENMARVKGDLDWFIEKFDYRNASSDWKNSRDAVSRSMQKLQGIYPTDPPFKSEPR